MSKTPVHQVLIAQNPSGEPYHLDVASCGGFEGACLTLFNLRDADGLYLKDAPTPPQMPPPLLTDDLDEWLQNHWSKIESEYEQRHEAYKQAVREWAVLRRARQGDANAASWIIRARKDYEDEDYTLFDLLGSNGAPLPIEPLEEEALDDLGDLVAEG